MIAQLQTLSSRQIYLSQLEIESHLNLHCHLDMVLEINITCKAFARVSPLRFGYGLI